MKITIFYSWQSDTRAAANRTLIERSLEDAAKDIREDGSIALEPVVDRDTLAVPGAPDIDKTILEKIDASEVFVADVTIVNTDSGAEPTPNPNVLIELGYALKALGTQRVVLVQNTAFGSPERLPFDLRQKRVLCYESPEQAEERATIRRQLQAHLRKAISTVLAELQQKSKNSWPVELGINYEEKRITGEHHDYELRVTLTNKGTKPIKEWYVDVEFPTRLLNPHTTFAAKVQDQSDDRVSLFRATRDSHRFDVYPGDTKLVISIPYYVDTAMFWNPHGVFEQKVVATAYIHGERAAVSERVARELQVF